MLKNHRSISMSSTYLYRGHHEKYKRRRYKLNKKKPTVMIVGTFHFQGSLDIVQTDPGNLISDEKQQEIIEVVERMTAFKPTKIAVEVEKKHNERMNENYQNYINNSFDLTLNEVHQLGFRVGKRLNLETISAVDWMDNVGNRSIDEVWKWANENQPSLHDKIMNEYISKLQMNLNDSTVLEAFQILNKNEKSVPLDHEAYMQMARIGNENEYVGIDWVRWWYQRNLIIYKNILDLIEDENERILLIIGVGHRHLIDQFLQESGEVNCENTDKFLN